MFYYTFKLYKLLIFFMTFSMKRFFIYYKCIAEVPPNLPLEKLVQAERNPNEKKEFFSFGLVFLIR